MPRSTPGFGTRFRHAWDAIRHGQQVSGWGLVPITVSFNEINYAAGAAQTFDIFLFSSGIYALTGEWLVVGARAITDTTLAADAVNFLTWQIRNNGTDGATGATNLSATGRTTAATAITADTPFVIPVEGPGNALPRNAFMGENESLILRVTESGAVADRSAVQSAVTVYLLNCPPGRSAFQQ